MSNSQEDLDENTFSEITNKINLFLRNVHLIRLTYISYIDLNSARIRLVMVSMTCTSSHSEF